MKFSHDIFLSYSITSVLIYIFVIIITWEGARPEGYIIKFVSVAKPFDTYTTIRYMSHKNGLTDIRKMNKKGKG